MAWTRITEDKLISALNRREVEAYRRDFEVETVSLLIADVTAEVRDYIASSDKNIRLDPDESKIPPSCVAKALDILVIRILKRINVQPVQVRIDAAKSAEEYFQKIAEGRITPQGYDARPDEQTGGVCAVVVQNSRDRVTAGKLEGL